MPDEKIVCLTCRQEFVFTEDEKKWLMDRVERGILECFAKPKRCKECRKKKQPQNGRFAGSPPSAKPVAPMGSDKCSCILPPNAPFPACPHDIRGPKGEIGEPGAAPKAAPGVVAVASAEAPRAPVPVEVKPSASPPSPVAPESRRMVIPSVRVVRPAPVPVPPDPQPVLPVRDEEIRVILLSDDYEKLICREEIVWKQGSKKVRIILADIGFPLMKAALERAMLKWLKS